MLTNVLFILVSLLPKVITKIRLNFVLLIVLNLFGKDGNGIHITRELILGPSFTLCD